MTHREPSAEAPVARDPVEELAEVFLERYRRGEARACFDRANASVAAETRLSEPQRQELTAFRAEAETVLRLSQGK